MPRYRRARNWRPRTRRLGGCACLWRRDTRRSFVWSCRRPMLADSRRVWQRRSRLGRVGSRCRRVVGGEMATERLTTIHVTFAVTHQWKHLQTYIDEQFRPLRPTIRHIMQHHRPPCNPLILSHPTRKSHYVLPPALTPKTVTLLGSPPNFAICSCTHLNAAC
jgi:hypothetical protein